METPTKIIYFENTDSLYKTEILALLEKIKERGFGYQHNKTDKDTRLQIYYKSGESNFYTPQSVKNMLEFMVVELESVLSH